MSGIGFPSRLNTKSSSVTNTAISLNTTVTESTGSLRSPSLPGETVMVAVSWPGVGIVLIHVNSVSSASWMSVNDKMYVPVASVKGAMSVMMKRRCAKATLSTMLV